VINPDLYWDNRATRTQPLGLDFSAAGGICRTTDAHYAWVNPYLSSSNNPEGQTSVMTLCPNELEKWVSRYQAGETMEAASTTVYDSDTGIPSLDTFQGYTLSTALMHEFTHAPAIVGVNFLSMSLSSVIASWPMIGTY
jgi:hypothetical protein